MTKQKKEENENTTISISIKNWKKLVALKNNPKDSMEEVISRLLEKCN